MKTPIEKLPVFVRGGSIIPMQNEKEYTKADPPDSLLFEIFPEGSSHFELYEDDGFSNDYEKGIYSVLRIECSDEKDSIKLVFHPVYGAYQAIYSNCQVKMHLDKKPEMVTSLYKGTAHKYKATRGNSSPLLKDNCWYYDAGERLLWISFSPDSAETYTLIIDK